MDRCLGRPLPYQPANPTQAPPAAGASKDRPPLILRREDERCHTVLARVSSSCPLLPGRFLRVTHPSATVLAPEGAFSFDLHVLSLPPTFNLSHDQTLQLKNVVRVSPHGFVAWLKRIDVHSAFAERTPTRMACLPFYVLIEQLLIRFLKSVPKAWPKGKGCGLYAPRTTYQGAFRDVFRRRGVNDGPGGAVRPSRASRCQLFLPRRSR